MLKVLYAGSPEAAAKTLEILLNRTMPGENTKLLNDEIKIVGVLTNPPAMQGRHHDLIPTPVQVVAEKSGIPVFTPEHLDSACREKILPLGADILVCFAYGHIFGPKFLSMFKFGGINLHPSLLPKYRGCTPVPAAILNRDSKTGISIQKIVQEMDCGNLLVQKEIELDFTETADFLFEKSAILGAREFAELLNNIEKNQSIPEGVPQTGEVSYSELIKKEDGKIDWSKSALAIDAKIRAYTPDPGTFTSDGKLNLKIIRAKPAENPVTACADGTASSKAVPGMVLAFDKKNGIYIACGEGQLIVTELQWQGKKAMNYKDFMNGSRNFIGTVLQ